MSDVTQETRPANGHGGQVNIDGGIEAPPAPEPPVEEIRVDGTTQLGLFDAGGKRPQSATIALTGGAVKLLDGRAFAKGDVVKFEGTAVITDVGQKDERDSKTGIVVAARQYHRALVTDLRVSGA